MSCPLSPKGDCCAGPDLRNLATGLFPTKKFCSLTPTRVKHVLQGFRTSDDTIQMEHKSKFVPRGTLRNIAELSCKASNVMFFAIIEHVPQFSVLFRDVPQCSARKKFTFVFKGDISFAASSKPLLVRSSR